MTTVSLAPIPFQYLLPSGAVANGAQLFFYAAGTTSKQNTFTTSSGVANNTNPIVLDASGSIPSNGEVWFQNGQAYKVVLAPANDTDPPQSPYWTRDNLSGINDSTQSIVEWIGGPAPTFVNTTQFTVAGDQHLVLDVNRQVKLLVTAGTIYGYITASSYGSSVTTVTVSLYNGAALDSGLSSVWYGLLDPAHPSCPPIFNSPLSGTTATFTGTASVAPATASAHAVALGQFISSLAGSGYLEIPAGPGQTFVLQWAANQAITTDANGNTSWTFPIPFPHVCIHCLFVRSATSYSGAVAEAYGAYAGPSPTAVGLNVSNSAGIIANAARNINAIAIGY